MENRRLVVLVVSALALGLGWGSARADVEGRPCEAETTDETIEYGDLLTCDIDQPADSDLFRFTGGIDERVVVVATEVSGSGLRSVCIELFDPDGDPLSGITCGNSTVRLNPVLPATGIFTVRVREQGDDATIPYHLVLERVYPASPAARPLTSGVVLEDELLSPAVDLDLFVFQGASGDTVSVRTTDLTGSGLISTCFEVFNPDGSVLKALTCGNGSVTADLDLVQTGPHVIVASEQGNDAVLRFDLEFQCLFGQCPELQRPDCDITLTQDTYADGETVAVQSWRISNAAATPVAVELKAWFEVPGFAPVSYLNVGADGTFQLPAAFDHDLGGFPLFEIGPSFPRGVYALNCRIVEPVTGATTRLDENRFEVP